MTTQNTAEKGSRKTQTAAGIGTPGNSSAGSSDVQTEADDEGRKMIADKAKRKPLFSAGISAAIKNAKPKLRNPYNQFPDGDYVAIIEIGRASCRERV